MHWRCWSFPHRNWVGSPFSSPILSDSLFLQPNCKPSHPGGRLQRELGDLPIHVLRHAQLVTLEPSFVFGDSFEIYHAQVSSSIDFPIMCVLTLDRPLRNDN